MGNSETRPHGDLKFVINKVVMPGEMSCGRKGIHRKVFCKIAYNTPKQLEMNTHIQKHGDAFTLSITGVCGPTRFGNAYGGCGQIQDGLLKIDRLNVKEGWDRGMLVKLVRYWQRYHLNGMRSGCVHQDEWDTAKEIEVYTYFRGDEYGKAEKVVKEGRCGNYSEYVHLTGILAQVNKWLFGRLYKGSIEDAPEVFKRLCEEGFIKQHSSTKERAGHVRFNEHPEGLFCKPCPVCGYEYGTGYIWRQIPQEVLEWLAALPETKEEYAWV
jgi:hypothetical protein